MGKKIQSEFQRNFSSSFAQLNLVLSFLCAFCIKNSEDFINNGIMVEKKPFIFKGSNIIAMYPSHIV